MADHGLARLVGGMRLSAVENLQAAEFVGTSHQALRIGKEQVGPFISCGAAGEADGENLRPQFDAGAILYRRDESALGFEVRLLNFGFGDIDGIAQGEVILPPAGKMTIEGSLEGRRRSR